MAVWDDKYLNLMVCLFVFLSYSSYFLFLYSLLTISVCFRKIIRAGLFSGVLVVHFPGGLR